MGGLHSRKVGPCGYLPSKERMNTISHSVLGVAAGLEGKPNAGGVQLNQFSGAGLEVVVTFGQRLVGSFLWMG